MPVIGLDLGKHSFRAVELEEKRDKAVITHYGTFENPRLNLDSEKPESTELYASAIRDFFTEVGFSTSRVVLGLEENNIFMRTIKIPEMSEKDLSKSIRYEAEQNIPLPLDKVRLSYQKLDKDLQDKTKMNVQIVAAKKDILNSHVDLIKKANLTPVSIEPQTFAMSRALIENPTSSAGTIILDVGFSNSFIVISYGGHVRFTRTLATGGDSITKSLQQDLGLDYMQAEEYKRTYGLNESHFNGKVYNVIKPVVDGIIVEIKRASIFFTNNNPGVNIKRVIIAGGTALMPEFLPYLAANLDLEVELANPLRNLEISSKLAQKKDTLIETAPLYSVATGLALKGLK
jgi:type IV pilus assembly protein PilM